MAKQPTPKVVSKKHMARIERERRQNRYIMVTAIVVLVLVVGVIGYGVLYQNILQGLQPVAKVGSTNITTNQFQVQVRYTRSQLIQQYQQYVQLDAAFGGTSSGGAGMFASYEQSILQQLSDSTTLGRNVLTRMIDDQVIRQEAAKRDITVTQAEVDKELQSAFGYFPSGTPTPTQSSTPFSTSTLSPQQLAIVTITPTPTTGPTETPTATATNDAAAATATAKAPTATPTSSGPTPTLTITPPATPTQTPTPYTFEGFKTQQATFLNSVKAYGFKENDLRNIITAQLYRQKLESEIEKDVKPFQEQVWARQIAIPDQVSAIAVLERLKKGEDFGKVASSVSTDTATKGNGGDMGWFPRTSDAFSGEQTVDPAIEAAAFSYKIGDISSPIKTASGYAIIQVLGHENRPLTSTELQNDKDGKFQKWIDETKKGIQIATYDTVWQARVPTEPTLPATTG